MPPATRTTRRRPASKAVVKAPSTAVATVEELIEQGRTALLQIVAMEDGSKDQYTLLADTLIALRQKFQSPGKDMPDWRGRSQAYRDAAAQVYAESDIPPDSETAIQARIRYVINERIREVAPAEHLEALEYKKGTAVERAQARRDARKKQPLDTEGPVLQAAPTGPPITTRAQAFRAVRGVVEQVVWELPIPEEEDEAAYVELMSELVETAKMFEQLWALHERRRSPLRHDLEVRSTYLTTVQQQPKTPEEAAAIRRVASMEARFLSDPRKVTELSQTPPAELEAASS